MFWKTLGRLVLVPIAFLLATAAAGFVAVTLGLERITHAVHGQEAPEIVEQGFDFLWQGSLLASGASILPALAVVIIGEVARIRSWLYYVIGGGIALAAIPLLARLGAASDLTLTPVGQVLATAGFAGGLVYWLVAGRTA
ncbi:MAG: hypothetical protein WC807_11010 [Hyphomicrobium sp.]|jgi:hypothetical protein